MCENMNNKENKAKENIMDDEQGIHEAALAEIIIHLKNNGTEFTDIEIAALRSIGSALIKIREACNI